MNDIMSNSQDQELGTQNSNSEDELLTFFSSPTMKKLLEVMVIQTFDRVLKPKLENSIRNVVKHELELAEKKFLTAKGNTEKGIQAPKPRSLKLKFLTKVSDPVLTGVEIKGEGGNAIEVALIDDNTGEIVESGPEASAKVEIVVLKGEFGDDDGCNWRAEEFCRNIVSERKGNKSLLAETVHVRLNKGVGSIDQLRFTHSSIYMRTGMFRLGARIVDTFNNVQVKEARTESFTVKDGRQQYYEKHDPPSLSDGVHRLINVGRGSKKNLRVENVNTVEDFLILLLKDHDRLICVLNLKPRQLEETLSHARRCIINERMYSFIDFQEKEGVVFNIVGEVLGLILESHYLPMHQLSESDKAKAQRLLVSACEHWDHVIPVDDETSLVQYLSQKSPSMNPFNSPSREVPSTNNGVENLRISDGHCHTSRVASAVSLNGCGSTSISNLDFSNFPIYSPTFQDILINEFNFGCEDFGFESDVHQPHDGSAPMVKAQRRWRLLFGVLILLCAKRRAAALDIQVLKKRKVI
ncbi:calmodulin-binding protein 60 A-like [Nicotiana tomentosiformis]|uniref:calmodulin-binding protein 60 A-like n=1 Tax=Nicotiana tomentosiformis TaxID=4098 RepID=UPI00051BCF0E|nr:PREDICTED: calmodulin-binding protein 60 A-like [Nicotiana tabacum]XP_018628980.1 calmodulin-binding protein 60 A-like [Nicotiana tomentosiformis]XP_018628981.1 calmodulin-binding protein 60 A-like [Nicotiana tomentosiformis]XP_033514088.1 calmodulin-binding protein 60 A-like [Nicotiana tomentosiformis]XP_033514089.1 calmodulin-binding protein 60 A-like [Nicotiana tomentosiformis]